MTVLAIRSPRSFAWSVVAIAAFLTALAGCARNPETLKAKYLQSGDDYARQGKQPEALLEYRNAVQASPTDGEARLKLAEALANAGDYRSAGVEYARAADLLPDRADVQLKSGTALLSGGAFDAARVRAEKALALMPQDVDARILLASALAGLKQFDPAIAAIEEAIRIDPARSSAYASLGVIEAARGRDEAAERALGKAVELEQGSARAHVALASFYWARQRLTDAEGSFTRALAVEPDNVLAHRGLASLAMGLNRAAEAETHLKRVAELTGAPEAALELADFYVRRRQAASARAVLEPLLASRGASAEAGLRLAVLDHAAGNRADAYARVDKLLAAEPKHMKALVTRSEMLLKDSRVDEAAEPARRAVEAHPDAPSALLALARVEHARNQPEAAIEAYKKVLRVDPNATAAHVALAQLNLSRGRTTLAVGSAEQALGLEPANPDARLALVRGLLAQNELERAEGELTTLLRKFPDSAAVRAQNGVLLMRRKDVPGARREFERALAHAPANTVALGGLVTLDLASGQPDAARSRLKPYIDSAEVPSEVLLIAARTFIATGDPRAGEGHLRRILQKDAGYLPAYSALAQLYRSQRRLDEAVAEFDALAARDPRPVGALTAAGIVLMQQGKTTEARRRFERALAVDPNAPIAANNLAWLMVESGENLDVALQLAQAAYAKLPKTPEVGDTLGFIYYKKDLLPQAVSILKTAVEQDPAQPTYRYHLGLALARSGDTAGAREHLTRALKLNPDFGGAADARSALERLPAQ